ncbi:carbamoyltransferase [Haloferax sp. Atlit-10N]|uniref:carbamoyltransferase family protein n=1 Tax=Haloferax sp. Atlit-10N TaxID=2077204 RepID=UPI000E386612|nr:carbamoyltransferase C-terminal domain-containing protein [Haloferax sp. Atlit-10N]RDZ55939.1 carbamoyltransferase [Haloferax sp. Atlit-10N]
MSTHTLSFKPAIGLYGQHDPSAALFEDETLIFAIEEERLTRDKHAPNTFPEEAIRACLDYRNLELSDLSRILLPYDPSLQSEILDHYLLDTVRLDGLGPKLSHLEWTVKSQLQAQFFPTKQIENRLRTIGTPIPPVETRPHHACHAASAFQPSGFDEALVLTIDAKGEYDATVVWRGDESGLERIRTYDHPNSLGLFYAVVTEYLGYRMFNGEGKVMGLAPYGNENPEIESVLREVIETGCEYDVTSLTQRWGAGYGVGRLEELFDRPRNETPGDFDQWEKDFAYTAQKLLEETVLDIVETYTDHLGTSNVALAGGVMLNCKLNKQIRESEAVENVFIQPVAHDAGLPLGAGWLEQNPRDVPEMTTVYLGPEYTTDEIVDLLETNKIDFSQPLDLERYTAERLADGALVGWFQGRLELGPRALGGRSILADPRSVDSRDRVNRFVKHREGWRPFAPSMLEKAVDEYFVDATASPFMIDTFDVREEKQKEIAAVLHPADHTTRPQTVREDQHPRYYRLISEFESLTGVPVVLNTSFNDHGEPIVNTPTEALKDFFGMGLDVLVLEDVVIEKQTRTAKSAVALQSKSEPTVLCPHMGGYD